MIQEAKVYFKKALDVDNEKPEAQKELDEICIDHPPMAGLQPRVAKSSYFEEEKPSW